MLLVKLIFCLTAFYVGADAAQALMRPQEKPAKFAHLEGCYLPSLDRVIKYGEEYTPLDSCIRYFCGSEYTQIHTCGLVHYSDKDCEVDSKNSGVPYPKCCKRIKCKQSDGTYKYNYLS